MEFIQVLVLILFTLAVILHSLGAYLLHQTKKSSSNKTQLIYLLNLSVAEAVLCATGVVKRFLKFIHYEEAAMHITLYQWTGCCSVYYLAMISLTLDRLMAVYFNIRYPLYCTERKVNTFLISQWIISIAYAVIINEMLSEKEIFDFATIYFFPLCDGAFLLVALINASK